MEQDWYYHDLSHIPLSERNLRNFDHPDAFDFEFLRSQLGQLLRGESIEAPIYDYKTHSRLKETQHLSGHRIIVLEGILVLADKKLREMMNIKLFIDAPPDVRFIRRLKRDIHERGRDLDSVIEQYEMTVSPMHDQFVEPTKRYADIIIPVGGYNQVAIDLLQTKIQSLLKE
jgi:uridine kinase